MTGELSLAIEQLAKEREEERSRVIETLLREHPYVQEKISRLREIPALKKGRPPEEMERIIGAARREMDRRFATGEVKLHVRK